MNELMIYEDIRSEFELSLKGIVNDDAIDKLCQEWVKCLCETKAENSRPPSLAMIPDDTILPAEYGDSVYVLVESESYTLNKDDRFRKSTGLLDDPRLLFGRMFQVQDIISSLANAFFKSRIRGMAKEMSGQSGGWQDPVVQLSILVMESIPDLVGDFRSFMAKKRVSDPKERAITIMAFSQYETDLHDTKNEPFTTAVMVEWLKSNG